MIKGTKILIPARAVAFNIGLLVAWALGSLTPSDAAAQQLQLSPQLQTNMRFLHVGLTGGRVTATSSYSGRSFSSTSQSKDRQESLKVDMNGVSPSVDYQLTTDGFKVSVLLTAGNELRVRREPKEGSTAKAFELHQPPEGHVTIVLGPDPTKLEASSLWHLLLDQPELAKNELEPLLRLLRPGWPLVSQARAVEEALYKQVDASAKFDRNAWSAMVSQLGSDKYLEREEADRKLRELGQSIVPYLKNLSPGQLDAEQIYRIRAIARQYETEENEDNADTAAGWLSADPEIWYILARRADAQQRALVRMQLERILGEPVEFDPAAAGDVLQTQLKRLREQIDRRKQADSGSR
ncbi:MAG: hypothetical protein C0483_15950 [Pirellula sp.]|nr:hypothetical protein [Pirellula sp.]